MTDETLSHTSGILGHAPGVAIFFLELVIQQWQCVGKKMRTTKRDTVAVIFHQEQSGTDLAERQPLVPTAELCASPVDNCTTFSVLKLGTLHSNPHVSLVPG